MVMISPAHCLVEISTWLFDSECRKSELHDVFSRNGWNVTAGGTIYDRASSGWLSGL